MKVAVALAALAIFAGCGPGALNPNACANHDAGWCGPGKYCQKQGEQSRCAPLDDGGPDGAADDSSEASSMLSDSGPAAPDARIDGPAEGPAQSGTDASSEDPDSSTSADAPLDRATETAPSCGDGVTTPPEECDLGAGLNTGAYGGCTSTCKRAPRCGDGMKNGSEDCDLGAANKADAYGKGLCTADCKNAPYCGDGSRNGAEICDNGATGSTDLGACNPECTGYYEKKTIKPTGGMMYSTNLGGPAGADGICQSEFGAGWKALIVGGSRRATRTPFKGDDPQDWVLRRYTYYYNQSGQLVWRTDDVPLIGVHAGKREDVYADVFVNGGNYPWSGWAADWTTLPDNDPAFTGTCNGWTNGTGWASFAFPNLMPGQSEACGGQSFLLCVQQ